jgi:hypothetical protein
MYQLREKADKIGNLITLTKEKHTYRRDELKAIQEDIKWGTAHLLAKLFFESEILPYTYITPEQLNQIANQFEVNTASFDLDNLMAKHWIRIIGGVVEIPSGIYSAAKQYEKIKDGETEFKFLLRAVEKTQVNGIITNEAFSDFLKIYQDDTGIQVSLEKCKALHWLAEEGDKIKIHNLQYNKPIFQYKKELEFINYMLSKKQEECEYKLQLSFQSLETIHLNHKTFFSETPSIDDLMVQKLILKEGDNYFLNFLACEPAYWVTLGKKIGLLLFRLMQESGNYPTDSDLFRAWVLKMNFIDDFIESPELMDDEDRKKLLHIAMNVLLNEEDLIGTEKEIVRLVLSKRRAEYAILTNAEKIGFPDLTMAKDIFELFNLMEECNEVHQSDLLWMQEIRWYVQKLVQLIVFYDNGIGEDGLEYPHIRKLLIESFNKPYLLWKTCFYINYWKPEIIPYLCLDVKVVALSFNLYFISKQDVALSETSANKAQRDILNSCFNLLLSGLINSNGLSEAEKALRIFECLVLIAERKWELYANDNSQSIVQKRQHLNKVFDSLIEILDNKKIPGSYYTADGEVHKYLFAEIVAELFDVIKEYDAQKIYREGVVGVPFVKMDLLSVLLKYISTEKFNVQKGEVTVLPEKALVEQFLKDYTYIFNLASVTKWSYMEGKMETVAPLWSTHQKGIELIPWERWFLLLENHGLLPQVLTPANLKLVSTDDKWNKHNQYSMEKIRKHIEILILTHQRLREKEYAFKQEGFKVDTVISRIEQTITDYIVTYSVEDTANGYLDIFEDRNERTVFGSQEHALLPVVAQSLNKFEQNKKIEILTAITKSDSFTKCLKLLEFLSSDADINFIKEQIKTFDVAAYLDEKSYIPEIETVVVKLSEFEEFIDKAKEALSYWETRILTQRNNTEYLITHYRIKLLIAYYEGDEQTILNEKAPPVDSFSTSKGFEFKPAETRDFYLGLVKLKNNDPVNAYTIFCRLINSSKNDKSSIAINRLYSHISLALLKATKEGKEKALSEALDEWESYENSIPEKERVQKLEYVKENVWINKLNVFHKLQRHAEFDRLFSGLDKSYQMRKDFFELRIKNYVQRNQYQMAKFVVADAKNYHQSKEGLLPEFIKIVIEKLEDEEDYRRLRQEYLDLVSRTPDKLMQILPENIVGKRTISDYILKEICGSANDVLDNINAVNEIDLEDKYSDLLILSLQSKLRCWNWKVGNKRGGFSASNKRNPGELDFVITSVDNERIATCEALLLHGKNTSAVTAHAIKTFNYDHRRKLFFIIAYYNGKNGVTHWNDYKTNIVPAIKYPVGFPISKSLVEVNEFYTNNSVKAALATHGENTLVYHIFINLNYKM